MLILNPKPQLATSNHFFSPIDFWHILNLQPSYIRQVGPTENPCVLTHSSRRTHVPFRLINKDPDEKCGLDLLPTTTAPFIDERHTESESARRSAESAGKHSIQFICCLDYGLSLPFFTSTREEEDRRSLSSTLRHQRLLQQRVSQRKKEKRSASLHLSRTSLFSVGFHACASDEIW